MRIYDYLKYGMRMFSKHGMPLYLILFVTTKCNCKCRHCFVWKELNTNNKDLTLEEFKKISESMDNLLLLNLTGGEPFLRRDLPEIVNLFYKNNHVRHIAIPTNGMLKKEILRSTRAILKSCPDANLVIDVSLDDIGEAHDKIRGTKGAFQKAISSFKGLMALKKEFPNLGVGTLTTAMSINQTRLKEIYSYIKDNLKPDMASINLIRGQPREGATKNINIDYYQKVAEFLEQDIRSKAIKGHRGFAFSSFSTALKVLTHRMINRTIREKKFLMPCYAGTLSAVIYSDGKLFPCELLNKEIANLRDVDYNFRKAWFSKKADKIREWIRNSKCFCTHECFTNINIMFNPRFLPSLIYDGIRLI